MIIKKNKNLRQKCQNRKYYRTLCVQSAYDSAIIKFICLSMQYRKIGNNMRKKERLAELGWKNLEKCFIFHHCDPSL